MSVIYAVRHGDYANPEGIIPGRTFIVHLNRRGKEQAERIAAYLSDKGIRAIYSSPLARATETAKPSAKRFRLEVNILGDLTNVRSPPPNGLDGTPFSYFSGNAYKDPRHLKADGEMPDEIFARMRRVLDRMLGEYPDQNVAFFSHGDPIEFLRHGLLGHDLNPDMADKVKGYIARGDAYELVFDGRRFISAQRLCIQTERIVDEGTVASGRVK